MGWGGVFRSNNNGISYYEVNNGLTNKYPNRLYLDRDDLYMGTYEGIFLSTNYGDQWTNVNNGLTTKSVYPFTSLNNTVFAGTAGGGVFITTNKGALWTPANSGLSNLSVNALITKDNLVFAGTTGGVFVSSNNGTSWTNVSSGLTSTDIRALTVIGTEIFAGTNGKGIFTSTNNGTGWTQTVLNNTIVYDLYSISNVILAVTNTGVYISKDGGLTWEDKNVGIPAGVTVQSAAGNNTHFFVGTFGHSVYSRLFSEIVSVEDENIEKPNSFSLHQNFPNPFNPSTTINYSISTAEFVTLKVFDLLGREVATLINEFKQAGYYNVQLSTNNYQLSSGTYFYKLNTGNYSQTRKMVLLK